MWLVAFIIGVLFSPLLQYAKLNKFNTISGLAIFEDLTVAKALLLAIGLGAILIELEIDFHIATYHIKPFLLTGVIIGGLIFGIGMAILGYCPGTLIVSFSEGSLDAFMGILGGLTAGIIFTAIFPSIREILGPDLCKIAIKTIFKGSPGTLLVFILGILFIIFAFWLNKIDKKEGKKWILSGTGLALLNSATFYFARRPIGASTAYPYFGDLLLKFTKAPIFQKLKCLEAGKFISLQEHWFLDLSTLLSVKTLKLS